MRAHKFYSLFLVVVLLVAGIFVYGRIALELNKRAFAHARAAIDTVYADIVKNVGQPDNFKRSSTCSRPNQVYGQGPLSCEVSTTFIYSVLNMSQANIYHKKIQTIVDKQEVLKLSKPASSGITTGLVVNTYYSDAHDFYRNNGLNCEVSYWYDTPRQIELQIRDKNKKPLEVSITCNDWAKAQYYPSDQ